MTTQLPSGGFIGVSANAIAVCGPGGEAWRPVDRAEALALYPAARWPVPAESLPGGDDRIGVLTFSLAATPALHTKRRSRAGSTRASEVQTR